MDVGMVGGIIGGVLGVAGGAFGTYASIRNTGGPRERQLMVRAAVAAWVGISVFLALLFMLPSPYRFLVWIPYCVALPWAIVSLNRKQRAIRSDEERARRA